MPTLVDCLMGNVVVKKPWYIRLWRVVRGLVPSKPPNGAMKEKYKDKND